MEIDRSLDKIGQRTCGAGRIDDNTKESFLNSRRSKFVDLTVYDIILVNTGVFAALFFEAVHFHPQFAFLL